MHCLMIDLIDLGKIENHTFNIKNEYFDLFQVIKDSFQMVEHFLDDKKIKLDTKFHENAHYFYNIFGD